jgi:XFP C-terminal domain
MDVSDVWETLAQPEGGKIVYLILDGLGGLPDPKRGAQGCRRKRPAATTWRLLMNTPVHAVCWACGLPRISSDWRWRMLGVKKNTVPNLHVSTCERDEPYESAGDQLRELDAQIPDCRNPYRTSGAEARTGAGRDRTHRGRGNHMCVLNDLDRFHLVADVIDRVPQLGARAAYVMQAIWDKLIDHKQYIAEHGKDMPEITSWFWGQYGAAVERCSSTEADNV